MKLKDSIVLVAGYFDLLHSGHIRFLQKASQYGRVYVSLGSDANSLHSKGKAPVCSENERKYMLDAIKFVDEVLISEEVGSLSFKQHLDSIQPTRFIINKDGHTAQKQKLCESKGIEYTVLERMPMADFVARSSTEMREIDEIPHRLDLAGGFFDQKKINSIYPGSVVIANIETMNLEARSGMSSSTRNVIHELYGKRLPPDKSEQELANIILAYENFDQEYVSGATDAYGLIFSSVCRFHFSNGYMPQKIEKINDTKVLDWLERHLFLKQTFPRPEKYRVFSGDETFPESELREYAQLSSHMWDAIESRNLGKLIENTDKIRRIQQKLIPGYISESVSPLLEEYQSNGIGCKLMGAGGCGYMLLVGKEQPKDSQRITIRRQSLYL